MKNKWVQRLIFATGMLGIAGPGLVQALEPYRTARLITQIVCGLALAFAVQSKAQATEAKKADEPPAPGVE